jgi:hypothetical protein
MLEYVMLGTIHEFQEDSRFQNPVSDAITKHSIRLEHFHK